MARSTLLPFHVLPRAACAGLLVLASVGPAHAATPGVPPPALPPGQLQTTAVDHQAIEALLHTYTTAVSSKNRALFETLLLGPDIPFSGVGADTFGRGSTHRYGDFRRGVFGEKSEPFTQAFRDVRIQQDGALADVSLVFVNTSAAGASWGFKTLQLLKVDGQWKIASEFFTYHG